MSWFQKLIPSRIRTDLTERKKNVPEGLWTNCSNCSAILYNIELERNAYVCPRCQNHHRVSARKRLEIFLDPDGQEEIAEHIKPQDILKFRDSKKYRDRLSAAQKKTQETEALIVFRGLLQEIPVISCAFEFSFIGGSMGAGVGNRFAFAAKTALELGQPLICFSASGGARMQEAVFSLMQMAKTSGALAKLAEAGLPYISIMCDPTYGGVSASLAMLGDINIAEPGAMIGFAGPRVIEQTVRETLPEGFQQAEFLLEHGFVDMIVDRRNMRDVVARLLRQFMHHRQQAG